MILTVTLNPALDLTYTVDSVVLGATHRVSDVGVAAGGKGLNVARILSGAGVAVRATGLLGGTTGDQIAGLLAADGVASSFVPVAGESRRTVVVTDGRDATGFWEPGPMICRDDWSVFLSRYRELLGDASVVVLAGSLPVGVPEDSYARLATMARDAGTPVVLDTDGAPLRAGLRAEPTVVKPNGAELAQATGQPVASVSDARSAAQTLRRGTSTAVVASLGPAGLVASTVDGDWHARLLTPVAGNPTGAGDACVAALAAGLLAGRCWRDVLTDAVAYGGAAAAEARAGVVDADRMRALRALVVVEEI